MCKNREAIALAECYHHVKKAKESLYQNGICTSDHVEKQLINLTYFLQHEIGLLEETVRKGGSYEITNRRK